MSEAVSALNGASFGGIADIRECGLQGMVTVRADLSLAMVKKAAAAAAGVAMPGKLAISGGAGAGLAWMSPDELLLMCPYAEAGERVAKLTKSLSRTHALVTDVSDARAMFSVAGPAAREVLAKLCPVDMAPDAFGAGMMRRTRMAQIPAAIWMQEEDGFNVVCFRSAAQYAFELLKAAAQPGAEVGYF